MGVIWRFCRDYWQMMRGDPIPKCLEKMTVEEMWRELGYVPIVGPGVDALEARKEHGEVGPEITEDELSKSLRRTRGIKNRDAVIGEKREAT